MKKFSSVVLAAKWEHLKILIFFFGCNCFMAMILPVVWDALWQKAGFILVLQFTLGPLLYLIRRGPGRPRILPCYVNQLELEGVLSRPGGYAIAVSHAELEKLAVRIGVPPLSSFGYLPSNTRKVIWHSSAAGLACVQALAVHIRQDPTCLKNAGEVLADLECLAGCLEVASKQGVAFCLGVVNSGLERDPILGNSGEKRDFFPGRTFILSCSVFGLSEPTFVRTDLA